MKNAAMHSLIASIYDAALEPERWPATLHRIGDVIGAPASTVAILDGEGVCKQILASGIPGEFVDRFVAEMAGPGSLIAEATRSMPMLSFEVLSKQVGVERWRASAVYQEIYRPLDLFQPGGILLARGREYNIGFSVQFTEGKPSFDEYGRAVFEVLIPHLRRALSLFARFDELGNRKRVLTDTLDQAASVGLVVCDSGGSVILANRTAEEIANQCDGFAIGRTGVSAATPELTRALERAIAAAARTTAGDGLSSGASLRLARPSDRRPLLAIVSPLGTAEWELLPRRPAAILLICDPERKPELPGERLGQLFGLTCREAQIAALLAQGAELRDAAERLGISRGTAHTHLKRILEKTDTHRQAELVALLLRALAGLGHQTAAPAKTV